MKTAKENVMKIEVFEPAMCCPTGVCGPNVDPILPRFAADVDWIKSRGVAIERYNLSQQPAPFATNAAVKAEIAKRGVECLPLIVVGGKIVSRGKYPGRDQLAKLAGLKAVAAAKEIAVKKSKSDGGCCDEAKGCC